MPTRDSPAPPRQIPGAPPVIADRGGGNRSFYVGESECPRCHAKLDAAGNDLSGEKCAPGPGDLTICIECATPLIFEEGMSLRRLTEEEMLEMDEEQREHIEKICDVIVKMHTARASKSWR